jgi:hypothetical protein
MSAKKQPAKKAAKKAATKAPAKTGRPQAAIEPRLVEQLASIGCTVQEIAAACSCHVDTLRDRFSKEIEKGRENGKTRLRKKQIEIALGGNVTMLIFLGKNMLGQSDAMRTELSGPEGGPIRTDGSFRPSTEDEAVIRRIADARAKLHADKQAREGA